MENHSEHSTPVGLLTKYLAKEAGMDEIAAVENWIGSSDENRQEFEAFNKLWNYTAAGSLKAAIDIESEWKYLAGKTVRPKPRAASMKRILAIAATILIMVSLSIPGLKLARSVTEKTAGTQLATLDIPDGSQVTLNANSKLVYNRKFGKNSRELSLTGEAFFEVKPNASLPFIIKTGDARIEVVGTKFNVKARKNSDTKVTVAEGIVQVSPAKKPGIKTLLKAGETGILMKNTQEVQKTPVSDLNDYSWKTKLLVFENTSLQNVADVLANTYHVGFIVEQPVSDCAVTVTFTNQELQDILKVLQHTLNLKIQVSDKKIILSGKGCRTGS